MARFGTISRRQTIFARVVAAWRQWRCLRPRHPSIRTPRQANRGVRRSPIGSMRSSTTCRCRLATQVTSRRTNGRHSRARCPTAASARLWRSRTRSTTGCTPTPSTPSCCRTSRSGCGQRRRSLHTHTRPKAHARSHARRHARTYARCTPVRTLHARTRARAVVHLLLAGTGRLRFRGGPQQRGGGGGGGGGGD